MASEPNHPFSQNPHVTPQNYPQAGPAGYNYVPPPYYPAPDYPNAADPNVYQQVPPNYQPPPGYQQAPVYQYPPHSQGYPPNQPYFDPGSHIHSKEPTSCVCHHCHQTVTSSVVKRPGNVAWICCLVLFCFCFPFCLYPLICDPCLDTYHICPKCQNVISVKHP